FSGRGRHTTSKRDWSSDVCSSDLVTLEVDHEPVEAGVPAGAEILHLSRGGPGGRVGQRAPADAAVRGGDGAGRGEHAQAEQQGTGGEGGKDSLLHGCLQEETAKATAARAVSLDSPPRRAAVPVTGQS